MEACKFLEILGHFRTKRMELGEREIIHFLRPLHTQGERGPSNHFPYERLVHPTKLCRHVQRSFPFGPNFSVLVGLEFQVLRVFWVKFKFRTQKNIRNKAAGGFFRILFLLKFNLDFFNHNSNIAWVFLAFFLECDSHCSWEFKDASPMPPLKK